MSKKYHTVYNTSTWFCIRYNHITTVVYNVHSTLHWFTNQNYLSQPLCPYFMNMMTSRQSRAIRITVGTCVRRATPADRLARFRIYQNFNIDISIDVRVFHCFIRVFKYLKFLWNRYHWIENKMNFVLVWHKKVCIVACESEYTSRIAGPPGATRWETRMIMEGGI